MKPVKRPSIKARREIQKAADELRKLRFAFKRPEDVPMHLAAHLYAAGYRKVKK
jgi:hypothetical protein